MIYATCFLHQIRALMSLNNIWYYYVANKHKAGLDLIDSPNI